MKTRSIPPLVLFGSVLAIGLVLAISFAIGEQPFQDQKVDGSTVRRHLGHGIDHPFILRCSEGAVALLISLALFFGVSFLDRPPCLSEEIEAVMDL